MLNKRVHVHSDPMPVQDFLALEAVARRLARTYPPDWLERHAGLFYHATLAFSFLAAVLLGLEWGPWWGFLVPLVTPPLVLVVLPRWLFGREAGRPRWAHRLALLDRADAELVGRIAGASHGGPWNGERFFDIWRSAHCMVYFDKSAAVADPAATELE